MPRLLLTLLAVFLLAPAAVAQARTSLVEVPISGPETIATLERLGLDVTHDVSRDGARVLVYSDEDRVKLTAAGLTATELIPDVEAYHRQAREAEIERARSGERSSLPSGREVYRVLSEYYDELDDLAVAHPGVVRRVDLPRTSVEGRPLAGVEIASNVNRDDDGRPVYVVMGAHHARVAVGRGEHGVRARRRAGCARRRTAAAARTARRRPIRSSWTTGSTRD